MTRSRLWARSSATGWPITSSPTRTTTGDVYVLNQSQGCNGTVANATNPAVDPNCIKFTVPDASWSGGFLPSLQSGPIVLRLVLPATSTGRISLPLFPQPRLADGSATARRWRVQPLNLPFVQGANGAAQQIAIIRKAPLGEVTTSATGSSREYNKANVRILLASNQADLHPDRPGLLAEDIDLTAGGCVASPQGKLVGPVVGTPGSTRIRDGGDRTGRWRLGRSADRISVWRRVPGT